MSALTTVLMPARNAERTIHAAIASVLAQTDERVEIVVCDDASDRPLREFLADVDDPRLRVVRNERRGGIAGARNRALREVRTPFVSQLDADDEWEPHYVETMLPAFDDPSVGMVYANASTIGGPVPVIVPDASVHPIDTFPKITEQNPAPCPTVTARTDAVRGVGGYRANFAHCQDYFLYMDLVLAGWRFRYVDDVVARYRWPQPGQMSFKQHELDRSLLVYWTLLALRHPRLPGPKHEIRRLAPALARHHLQRVRPRRVAPA